MIVNTSLDRNVAEKTLLELEVSRIKQIDNLLINDVKRMQHEHNTHLIPMGIIYALGVIVTTLIGAIDMESAGAFVLGLCVIILIIVSLRLKIRKNLKLFNESKNRLEQAGMRLYRSKERNLINPVENLVKICKASAIDEIKYLVIERNPISLNAYMRNLSN